jgi:hypothetical protein
LEPGTYVVDQVINWWRPSAENAQQQFTVRLTYTVTEGEFGTLLPEPAPTGVTASVWSGGRVSDLPPAQSYWAHVDGHFMAYTPSAPAFVNARFFEVFPATIPANTVLLVVR